jgi:hypothetical protein
METEFKNVELTGHCGHERPKTAEEWQTIKQLETKLAEVKQLSDKVNSQEEIIRELENIVTKLENK